ncbi:hypothetical protein QYE76_041506 [Lolium multiflorum]|uniref:Tf2-1-like SH3-like domain-containing protein n=1 Tax=Lolium multiflorum TaxID=4521 RepID=A0AAD8WWH0_LOLMU|nr:hypothetical protein QYE76_041506 [Lolium multiflorum]
MAPFEALYGRKCRTPLNWSEVRESQVFGPDVLREAEEKVHKIREYLKTAQSRQKSYADKRRREMTFEIGDFVYLKVSPLKGMQRFQLKGKLAPRYVGPFKVLSRRGEVSYQLELPEEMAAVHNVFHISLLRKSLEVPEKTEVFKNIDHRSVDINTDLTYREPPEASNRKLEAAAGTRSSPEQEATPGSAAATRGILVLDNDAAHLSDDRRCPDASSDPLLPPPVSPSLVVDDDASRPCDRVLIARLPSPRTASGAKSH